METLKAYLKQPSTWKGLFGIAAAVGLITFTPEQQEAAQELILQIVAGVFAAIGLVDVFQNDDKKK